MPDSSAQKMQNLAHKQNLNLQESSLQKSNCLAESILQNPNRASDRF
ncbi:hypothetical protein [Helicobacter sp. CLO-3]|nr:hypothetical protein [Helicobacter sp. CLO-3]